MGVKYSLSYKDNFDRQLRVDISNASYNGNVIEVRGVAKSACTISYECGDGGEDIYEPIINSRASISLWQEVGSNIDIAEFQQAEDKEFTVEFYVQNELKWRGFMVPDGIKQIFQQEPYEINIVATDGIMLMDGVDYTHSELDGGNVIINYFRQILFADENLGINLPIRWVSSLTNPEFPLVMDIISGGVEWSPNGEGYTNINGSAKSNLYLLTELCKSLQCRIFQADGRWNLQRINDIVDGEYEYREVSGLGALTILEGTANVLKSIGKVNTECDYHFVDEDAVLTNIPSAKKIITTYEQEQRENVIPNGNMDIVVDDAPLYWNAVNATFESIPSLSDASGFGVEVTSTEGSANSLRRSRNPANVPEPPPSTRNEMNFYFIGNAKTGDVIFLSDVDVRTGATVNTYSYTVPPLFDNDTNGALLDFATSPDFFETPSVDHDPSTGEYRFYWVGQNFRIAGFEIINNVATGAFSFDGFLPIDTDILYPNINFGFKFSIVEGFNIDISTGFIDWNTTTNNIRVTYNRGAQTMYLNEFGFWVFEVTEIQIRVDALKPLDIAQVDFNNFQNIIMPLPSVTPIDRTNPPSIKVEFIIPTGRKVRFDDIYINVNDNHDVVEASFGDTTKNTKTENYTLNISSGHSGFHISSYMTDYANCGEEKFFSDGKFTGTLTAMKSHAILRNRYRPSILFEGSIYGVDFTYGEIYNIATLDNKNFLPLKADWNTEDNTVSMTCAEVRDDDIEIAMVYGSTNDKNVNDN